MNDTPTLSFTIPFAGFPHLIFFIISFLDDAAVEKLEARAII
jgi:hypothetical protein